LPEKDVFYFHSDHLGSRSYITTVNGQISQHVEYIAFGEVLFEEHNSSFKTSYLYNGKELDRETNLSYYGARYLDMKTSLWLNVDPLVETTMQAYSAFNNNPIRYNDPTGMIAEDTGDPPTEGIPQFIDDSGVYFWNSTKKAYEQYKYTDSTKEHYTFSGYHKVNSKSKAVGQSVSIDNSIDNKLDPSTVGKNLLGLTYPGGENPKTFSGKYSYSYEPSDLSEYPAIGHDRRYDNLKITGAAGLFTDTRAIGADYTFVGEELSIAMMTGLPIKTRVQAGLLGTGLGLCAAPKTIYAAVIANAGLPNQIMFNFNMISTWFNVSNQNVTNTPAK
jgi:RHS repeat-associated protein